MCIILSEASAKPPRRGRILVKSEMDLEIRNHQYSVFLLYVHSLLALYKLSQQNECEASSKRRISAKYEMD